MIRYSTTCLLFVAGIILVCSVVVGCQGKSDPIEDVSSDGSESEVHHPPESQQPESKRIKGTGFVTRFDIATRRELQLSRPLERLFQSDEVGDWEVLRDLVRLLGDWVAPYLDAHVVAEAIRDGMPLAGQEDAALPIVKLVQECAATLGMEQPEVFLRNHPSTFAYAGRSDESVILVLNSGLLDLYEGRPDELRFMIGRELGHAKCGHFRMRRAAYGILAAITEIDLRVVPDELEGVLPSLAAGRFFDWCRESEISADRAGLLCCGRPKVAFDAMQRQLHGLRFDSAWISPDSAGFDPDELVRQFDRWENRPFVAFVAHLQGHAIESPFMPERIAALKMWTDSGVYVDILRRQTKPDSNQVVHIDSLALAEISERDSPIDVYVVGYDETDDRFLRTKTARDMTSVTWKNINTTVKCMDGQPLFFEVWQDNFVHDTLLGGFVVYPTRAKAGKARAPIQWDWNDRTTNTRSASAWVQSNFGN